MDKKSKIILILLVITLLSLSSYASLSRFSKGINKEGSIQTTEMEYCKLNEIETLSECLIRNDSKQELSLALNTIDDRTNNASDQSGLYKNEDDYTVDENTYTYYYRGNVDNNWVKFGDYLWRIVRINGNGTIRMIYSGLIDAPNHTGNNANATKSLYSTRNEYNVALPRLNDSNNIISLNYKAGRYSTTYLGYMYNPVSVIKTFPDKTPSNTPRNNLSYFSTHAFGSNDDYFFKNFNPQEDCYLGNGVDDSGVCVLKCNKLGEYGDEDNDCIYTDFPSLITNPLNYDDTAPGTYKSDDMEYDIYQISPSDGGYRYTCVNTGEVKTYDTGEVYVSCTLVAEIVGTVKNNPNRAKVKFYGIFPESDDASKTNVLDSAVKSFTDEWYGTNILNRQDENNHYLEDYLSDEIFCNDRSSIMTSTYPLSSTGGSYIYESYRRTVWDNNPNFKCLNTDGTFNTNDAFTLKTSDTESRVEASGIGNNMLTYPVALITSDEVSFAGSVYGVENQDYYLYTGVSFHTMTPGFYTEGGSDIRMISVLSNGGLTYGADVVSKGVRPVINLKSDILYKSGNGTENNPYIIDINN